MSLLLELINPIINESEDTIMKKFVDSKFIVLSLSKDESIMKHWDSIEWSLYCYHSDRKMYKTNNMRQLSKIVHDIVYK